MDRIVHKGDADIGAHGELCATPMLSPPVTETSMLSLAAFTRTSPVWITALSPM